MYYRVIEPFNWIHYEVDGSRISTDYKIGDLLEFVAREHNQNNIVTLRSSTQSRVLAFDGKEVELVTERPLEWE